MDLLLVGLIVAAAILLAAVKLRRMLANPDPGRGCACEHCTLPEEVRRQCDAQADADTASPNTTR